VIEAKNISKAFGTRPIVKDFSIRIMRSDRIGIAGPNGSGKTTLVKLMTGALAPDAGEVRLGANLEMATLDQGRERLDPETTLSDALTGGRGDTVMVNGKPRHVIGYLKDFLFSPEQPRSPLRVLSGGERARLTLAQALAKPSNVLVLDEPTNDLDLETLDVLEEMLGDYGGTVILISHDRDFLDRIVNAIIVPEGDGSWTEYAGGYSDMLEQRGRPAGHVEPAKTKPAPSDRPASAIDQAPSRKRKLSFHEKHALDTLPNQINALQTDIRRLQDTLNDPNLYARDQKAFSKTSDALTAAQTKLAAAEEKWLELEILREDLEGQ
jgi:ATP-binding cassette subfamily F protein uup